jgi:DNA-binding FadR family transcriptional regulator
VTAATPPLFRPVDPHNAFELVVEQVSAAIDLALLVPGERLPPERELAAVLGVSRPTVREALRVLARDGYVCVRRGAAGGAFVLDRPASPHPEQVREGLRGRRLELLHLLEWRRLVEAEAAALAALRASDDELRALRARLIEARSRAAQHSQAWRAADSRFHIAIAEASGNPHVVEAVRRVRAKLAGSLDAILTRQAGAAAAASEHEAILAALQARDPDEARATSAIHGHTTEDRLRAYLQE